MARHTHYLIAVIPKSVSPALMAQNLDVFRIAALETGASGALDHSNPAVAARIGSFRLS